MGCVGQVEGSTTAVAATNKAQNVLHQLAAGSREQKTANNLTQNLTLTLTWVDVTRPDSYLQPLEESVAGTVGI